ncbi:MAG: hypothetical protein R3C09_25920 [Pirellulaceae bacterium]
MTMLVDKIGVLSRVGSDKLQIKPALVNSGAWRHQYADPTNQADSRDPYVGSAARFACSGLVVSGRRACPIGTCEVLPLWRQVPCW